MPEALVSVPPLQIPAGNSSELGNSTGAETTDRSTGSRRYNNQVGVNEKKLFVKSQCKSKLRKSFGRRIQKKLQLRPLTSEKNSTRALTLKSHIPRALVLTPSSSTTSLATSDSLASPLITLGKALAEEKQLVSANSTRSCLVREKSALILAFRQRKSLSQMDFCYTRRQINFPIPSPSSNHRNKDKSGIESALVPSNCDENMTTPYHRNSFVHKMFNHDYYFTMPGRDPQMAGMKIFATIMLNAWRKRRDEVRRLVEEVADLKRGAIKAKNQIHVFSSLFRVEQKRNDELNCQLKRSLEDINLAKSSCESLTTSLISLKADKAFLEQQLLMKEQEYESINTFLAQTKSDLFKSMTVQRELQASLSSEQRNVQILENQKNQLINEICELNTEAMQKEYDIRKEVEEKCYELSNMKEKLKIAESQIKTINESTQQQLNASRIREECMQQEKEALENELKTMQKCLEATVGNRFKNCWNNSLAYQKMTLQVLHWLIFYTLPATPPPKSLPFGLTFARALSIIKR